jgi:hypothetical protein
MRYAVSLFAWHVGCAATLAVVAAASLALVSDAEWRPVLASTTGVGTNATVITRHGSVSALGLATAATVLTAVFAAVSAAVLYLYPASMASGPSYTFWAGETVARPLGVAALVLDTGAGDVLGVLLSAAVAAVGAVRLWEVDAALNRAQWRLLDTMALQTVFLAGVGVYAGETTTPGPLVWLTTIIFVSFTLMWHATRVGAEVLDRERHLARLLGVAWADRILTVIVAATTAREHTGDEPVVTTAVVAGGSVLLGGALLAAWLLVHTGATATPYARVATTADDATPMDDTEV